MEEPVHNWCRWWKTVFLSYEINLFFITRVAPPYCCCFAVFTANTQTQTQSTASSAHSSLMSLAFFHVELKKRTLHHINIWNSAAIFLSKRKKTPPPPTVWLSVVVCAKSWINIKHFAYKAIKFHLWVFGCFFLCLFFYMVALKTIFRAGTDFFILSN